jgi:small-conductance mechanosensitive channel
MNTRIVGRIVRLSLACLVLMAGSLQAAEPGDPAVLRFQNRDIVTLRATLGPVTPTERAEAASRRLAEGTARDYRREVTIVPYAETRAIALGDRMVFAIVPDDVDASAGETVDLIAAEAADNLREALAAWSEQRRPEVVLRGVIHVVIATVLLVVTLIVLHLVRKRLLRLVPLRAERALSKRRIMLFGRDLHGAAIKTLRVVINGAFVLAVLTLAYTWLTYSLKQFPITAPWGDGLAGFLAGTAAMIGLGILHGIPEMIIVVLVLFVTRFFANLVASLFDAVERGQVTMRGVHPDTADATRRIAVTLVWIFGIAIAYPFIPGSNSDAFKGISVLVGIMISLGSSGVINQAMSGMVVVFSRALKAGEYVSVADYEGTVTEVGALSTKLRTKRNEEINIPNAMLVSSTTKNYSRLAGEHGVILYSSVGIGYGAPWRTVHRLLVEAALRTPGIKREPAPFVRQSSLSSFCVDYTINAYLEQPEGRIEALSNLNANIQDAFNEAGIQIMTPAFESQPEERVLVPKSKWNEGAAPADRNP